MIKNSSYVRSLLIDPTKRAKDAQVGVDLTVNKISLIGQTLHIPYKKVSIVEGIITSDATPKSVSRIATYTPLDPLQLQDFAYPTWSLDPGVYSIEFEQGISPLPKDNTAFIINRSTVGRSGAMIRSSVYDPGFTTPNMGAILYVFTPIMIEQFARVAQILIFENDPVDLLYDGSYQGSKDIR